MQERAPKLTQTLVSLTRSLVDRYDAAEWLNDLSTACAELADVDSAGIMLADRFGALHVLAASTEDNRQLQLLQLQCEQGPYLDCYRSGLPVVMTNLSEGSERWPLFAAEAGHGKCASVHTVPIREGDATIGALGLVRGSAGALEDDDLVLVRALADLASYAIVQGRAVANATEINTQLQLALNSRVVIEQSKGVLAQLGQLDMEEAFVVLLRYSRDHNRRLSEVAVEVANRSLDGGDVLAHFRSRTLR
jgi:GAF domain-containing protein